MIIVNSPDTPLLSGDDAFLVRTLPTGSAVIASSAGSMRGTMNGVFAFLRALGFAFLAQDETLKPKGGVAWSTISLDLEVSPPFESRDMAAVPLAGPMGERCHKNCTAVYPGSSADGEMPTNLSVSWYTNRAGCQRGWRTESLLCPCVWY